MLLQPRTRLANRSTTRGCRRSSRNSLAAGIAVDSDGALVVVSEEITGPDGPAGHADGPQVRRRLRLRHHRPRHASATAIRDLKADRILYVVDARQALHFRLIFEAARRAGWLTDDIDVSARRIRHRARPGRPTVQDALRATPSGSWTCSTPPSTPPRRPSPRRARDHSTAELDHIAEQAGIGAVKYADLSTSRTKDYTFDVERMVSFTGNTGVYLQYAHTRICSILRKAEDVAVARRFGSAAAPSRARTRA